MVKFDDRGIGGCVTGNVSGVGLVDSVGVGLTSIGLDVSVGVEFDTIGLAVSVGIWLGDSEIGVELVSVEPQPGAKRTIMGIINNINIAILL